MGSINPIKPLNILVYTGEDPAKGDAPRYVNIEKNLKLCLHPNYYVIYPLRPRQVLEDPWQEGLKLLIVSCEEISKEVAKAFEKYSSTEGSLLIFGMDFRTSNSRIESKRAFTKKVIGVTYKGWDKVALVQDAADYNFSEHEVLATDDGDRNVIVKLKALSCIVFSAVHLELDSEFLTSHESNIKLSKESQSSRENILRDLLSKEFHLHCCSAPIIQLTPCFVVVCKEESSMEQVGRKKTYFTALELVPVNYSISKTLPEVTEKRLPVVYNFQDADFPTSFAKSSYLSNLTTKTLGRHLFFVEVVGSTMDIIYGLSTIDGACVVAFQQTQGKGRRENKWISPLGAALFSFCVTFPINSELGRRLSILPLLSSLSVVCGVRKTPGYQDIDLRVKWPNDIYCANKSKIGGSLVFTSVVGFAATAFIGSGANVDNSHPTTCINDMIRMYNADNQTDLPLFTTEQIIARCLSEFENLFLDFQTNGPSNFFTTYYSYWLHHNQTLILPKTRQVVTITAIDEFGALIAEDADKNCTVLQPDGNLFEKFENLVTMRK